MPKLSKVDPLRTSLVALDAVRKLSDTLLNGTEAHKAAYLAAVALVQAAIDLPKESQQ